MVYLARLMLRNKRGKICKKMSNCNTNSVNSKSAFLTYFQILFSEDLQFYCLETQSPRAPRPKYVLVNYFPKCRIMGQTLDEMIIVSRSLGHECSHEMLFLGLYLGNEHIHSQMYKCTNY